MSPCSEHACITLRVIYEPCITCVCACMLSLNADPIHVRNDELHRQMRWDRIARINDVMLIICNITNDWHNDNMKSSLVLLDDGALCIIKLNLITPIIKMMNTSGCTHAMT